MACTTRNSGAGIPEWGVLPDTEDARSAGLAIVRLTSATSRRIDSTRCRAINGGGVILGSRRRRRPRRMLSVVTLLTLADLF